MVLLLLIGGGLVWLSRVSFLQITKVEVSGATTLSTSTIADEVRQKLSGSYWRLFSKDNIFIYPKGQVAAALLSSMPTLESVEMHAKNFNTIEVIVGEREPKALWCGQLPNTGAPCFLLDADGVAYRVAGDTFSQNYERYYGIAVGNDTPRQYLSPEDFRSLSALVDTIAQNQKQENMASVLVDANRDVHLEFLDGFTLLFSLTDAGGDVYERFVLALGSEPFKSHPVVDFEYLDLRFGDKLYYKLK